MANALNGFLRGEDNGFADGLIFAAIGGLAVAAGSAALGAPPMVPVAAAALSVTAALASLAVPRGERHEDEDSRPGTLTAFDGAPLAHNAAFQRFMAELGRPAHPDALAGDGEAALALFALRQEAMAKGRATGVLPAGLLLTITRERQGLYHVVERAGTAAAPANAKELAALAEAAVSLNPLAGAVVDRAGTLVAANGPYRAMAGDGAHFGDGLVLEDDTLSRLFGAAKEGRTAAVDVAVKKAPDRLMRVTAQPFQAPDALIVAVTDVTAQSELEAQIVQSRKMQAIGQLAGGIAHDFNNVLTAIIVVSDLLLQSHRPSDPAFRDIMDIKQNAQRAANLVKQLLAFSRRQTLRPSVLNLNDVVADLSVMLDRLLGETIHLDINYGRDLWPVLADLSQVEQVVINLSVNARDAMAGGGTLSIRTRNVPHDALAAEEGDGEETVAGDAVLIEIEDVGTGIPQASLDKIFEPFFTPKAPGEGTGLGLSTVYGIVKQTGGALTVESVEGKGTTFRVYLPRTTAEAKAAASAPTATDEPSRPREPAADLTGSATLLIAEDEEAIRTFAARALTSKGYTVLTAASGLEAAEILAERGESIDLLLTDVIMPELDGPSLVRQVRQTWPALKVLFMSGYADGASVDELGDAQFLPKPFTLKALAEAVKRELARPAG
ncbi:MAG: ATP-binding protein [Pseudomonadota bacterium]